MKRISIFIPNYACPFKCIYCNQYFITPQEKQIDLKNFIEKIPFLIREQLKTIDEDYEVALFGGTFSFLPFDYQAEILKLINENVDERFLGIRFSTVPLDVDDSLIKLYQDNNVKSIELGVQSLDGFVLKYLRRKYTIFDVINITKKLKNEDFKVYWQFMTSIPNQYFLKNDFNKFYELPLFSETYSLQVAKEEGVDGIRIYPLLVLKGTAIEKDYKYRKDKFFDIYSNIIATFDMYYFAKIYDLEILKVGLQYEKDLAQNVLNYFDVSIGDKCRILYEAFENMRKNKLPKKEFFTSYSGQLVRVARIMFNNFKIKFLDKDYL